MSGTVASVRPEDLGIGLLFRHIHEAIIVVDMDSGRVVLWNPAAEHVFGYVAAEAIGLPVELLIPNHLQDPHAGGLARNWMDGSEILHQVAHSHRVTGRRKDGEEICCELTLSPLDEAAVSGRYLLAVLRDVTERVRAERLEAGQKHLLELIATGAPLEEVLTELVLLIEAQAPEMLASILLLDNERQRLRHGAAPSLPASYNQMIDGVAIGPAAGSCGTAAFRRAPVIVSDIATDPLWVDFREAALAHGLRACWSTPIMSSTGRLLGTFALYYRVARDPDPQDARLIDVATHLASIAIERERAEQSRVQIIREQAARDEAERGRTQLHDIFMQAPAFIAILRGPQHVFELVNPPYLQLIGHRNVVGKPVREALPEIAGQGFFELLDQVYTSGVPFLGTGMQVLVQREAGAVLDERCLDFVYQPLHETDGTVSGIFVQGVDVTERILAEERLVLYREIIAHSSEAIAIIDLQGRYLEQNAAHRMLLGYADEELHDETPAVHLGAEVFGAIAAELSRSGRYRAEHESHTKDGRQVVIELSAFAVRDSAGRPICYVGIKRDVTARKQAEAEREQLLMREQAARTQAEAAVQARDEFLSIASHELRNPVAGLKGTAQLMRRVQQRGQLTAERLDRYLANIERTSAHLAMLTEDLLDVSRLQRGTLPLRPRPTDLVALVQESIARHQAHTEAHRFRLHSVCDPCCAIVDPDRIEQIIANLLQNAIKYSPDGGEIDVTLVSEGAGMLVQVRDRGVGLPPGWAERIFEPFGRAPNTAEWNIPGLGLGLYICRRIAEQHGGRLWAQSAGEGQGTTMALWLPADSVGPSAQESTQ